MDIPLIQLQNVSKSFGRKQVLNSINLQVSKDDIYGIIGISGSGKTTILNMIICFWKPTTGSIFYQSRPVLQDQKQIRKIFGFVTQAGSFYSKLTVKENIAYFGKLYNLSDALIEERTKLLLKLVELEEAGDVLADQLSTGMERRLDIACALIHDPNVLILDEPTEDLDPVLRKEVLALIRKINDEGTTIIITSHLLSEMESVCNKISILHDGVILETGTPDQIKDTYSRNEEIHLKTYPGNYNSIIKNLNKSDIKNIVDKGYKLVIYTPKAEKVLHELIHVLEKTKEKLIDVDVDKPSLEEVFEYLTKKRKNV